MEMQTYKVRDPSGAMREIQGPAGASDEEVIAKAQELFGAKPRTPRAPDALDNPNMATEGMSGLGKFAAGAGKAIADTGQGVKQLASYVIPGMDSKAITAEVAEGRKRDKPLMDTGAGFTGNIVGNVGMALAPGGALKGAAAAASKIPAAARVAQALSAAGGAMLAPKSIPAALAVGGGMGLIQPASDAAERITSTLLGAGATAAVPLAGRAFRAGKAALEPFYESGRDQIIGRTLINASGGRADQVKTALQNATELVPGSKPTAGQAAKNAGIASLERTAVAISPEASVQNAERMAAQNAARVNVLEDIAGTGGRKAIAETARDTAADALYKQAREAGVDPQMAAMLKPQIDNLLERAPSGVLEKAKELARVNGEVLNETGSINGLHWMKKAVDDLLDSAKQTGIGKESQRAIAQYKNDMLTVIDDLSPLYGKARVTFQNLSKPINQMDTAQEIADKSINRLTGTLQPQAFARALDDTTAARATGFKKATLEGTFEPEQLARLNAIKEDVARAIMAQNSAGGPGSDTVKKLAYTNLIEQAGVPTFLREFAPAQITGNLLGRAADTAYGRANREIAEKLARGMMDPKEAARMMESLTPSKRAEIVQLLASRTLTPLGMSLPGLNASQQ